MIASRWPALARSVWLPVVADGIAGNIGTGATDEQAQALAAATSGAIRVLLHHIPATVPAACGATASTATGRCSAAPSTTSAGWSAG